MKLIDLTHSTSRKTAPAETPPVVVRSVSTIDRVPLDVLVTLATVVDLTTRPDKSEISRSDLARTGVSDIRGCILRTDWCDRHIVGMKEPQPYLTVDAAAYLLQGGVQTVASDFPMSADAADLLLHNNCVLVHCLSNVSQIESPIVQLIALPLKFEDTYSAEARVIAIEDWKSMPDQNARIIT